MKIEIKELIGNAGDSDIDSDSDSNQESHSVNLSSPIDTRPSRRKTTVQGNQKPLSAIIQEINARLKRGEQIDIAQYPPLFVVHYRGTHFFKGFFTREQRQTTCRRIESDNFQEAIYSPAVYELAKLKLGETIDTPEKKRHINKAISQLNTAFEKLIKEAKKAEEAEEVEETKNTGWHTLNSPYYQLYQRYVNNYAEFRVESPKKEYLCYQLLPSTLNPYISTADNARHAAMYALGGKTENTQGPLRPSYRALPNDPMRAKHPKVGYVQIFFHKLHTFKRQKPLLLSALHASNKINIKTRVLNERETTFRASIPAKHLVHSEVLRFPSFNKKYSTRHMEKYGLNNTAYNRYRKAFTTFNGVSTASTNLLEELAFHYADGFEKKAKALAQERGGHIVYIGLDGLLSEELPTTASISTVRKSQTTYDADAMLALYHSTAELDDEGEADNIFTDTVRKLGQAFDTVQIDPKQKSILYREGLNTFFQKREQSSSEEINASRIALIVNAHEQGFTCMNVPGDGYCFYHAVLYQLQHVLRLPEFAHSTVDDLVNLMVEEVNNHINDYLPYALNATKKQLMQQLKKPGQWADHLSIQAIANALQINIEMIRSDGAANTIVQGNRANNTVSLGYEVGTHYQSLIKENKDLAVIPSTNSSQGRNAARLLEIVQSDTKAAETQLNSIKELFAKTKALVNVIDEEYRASLLIWSIIYEQNSLFDLLLDHQASPYLITNGGLNPLHFACKYGNSYATKKLAKKFPPLINQQTFKGNTPLHLAIRYNQMTAVEYLCAQPGARKDLPNLANKTAIDLAQTSDKKEIILKAMVLNDNPEQKDTLTRLLEIVQSDTKATETQLDSMQTMFDSNKALVDAADKKYGATLLYWSIRYSQQDIFDLLLTNKANPSLITDAGQNPLHIACRLGDLYATEQLVKQFPNLINDQTFKENTPLHFAIMKGHMAVVEYLCDQPDTRKDLPNLANKTAIDLAQTSDKKEIILKALKRLD